MKPITKEFQKKYRSMDSLEQQIIKGAICNVPVECDDTCKVLPRPPERSGIMLKLKCKLEFRGHVYFEAVRPQVILNALNWLKLNNSLYNSITINIKNISSEFANFENEDKKSGLLTK